MINPKMIVLAREARGYTQSELSEILGIRQGSLSKFEKGIIVPNEEFLNTLSIKLDFPISFFQQDENILTPELLYYRRRYSIKKKVLLKAEAIMNIIRMNIEKLLSSVELPEVDIPYWDIETHGTPQEAAVTIRQRWGISKGRIENLVKILEGKGIIVVPFDFGGEKMDGLSMYTSQNHPIIFINNKIPGDRQRLTIAHELGHLVLHFGKSLDVARDVEVEAMSFAAELLVPQKEFINAMDGFDLHSLANQKRYWMVSMGALLYRGKSLNMLTDSQYRYIWQQMAMLGYKKNEPAEIAVAKEKPTLLKEIIEMHLNDLKYTKQELSEMLHINYNDMQDYFYSDNLKLRILRTKL